MLGLTKAGPKLQKGGGGNQPRTVPKVNDIINVKQKDGSMRRARVTGINPQTKKPQVDYNVGAGQ